MARLNVKRESDARTHEGARAIEFGPEDSLRRSVMNCLLWEDQFYEDGKGISDRIKELVPTVAPDRVAAIAVEARNAMNLRHVPLLLAREMLRHPSHRPLVADVLDGVIKRADELTEFLAIYWADNLAPMQQRRKEKLASQAKKGLARAFKRFDAYQLAKYDRDGAVRLRDVLFLTHPKPRDGEQAATWKALVDGTLKSPDTWEVELSAGKDKRETFERLISEGKLGALAVLRNLRNMQGAGVDRAIVRRAISEMNVSRVFPYRFITAAKHAPDLEPDLEQAMFRAAATAETLPGRTVLLVDVSGSMDWKMGGKSESTRIDAACGLAILAREICEDLTVYSFSSDVVKVPTRRGFGLAEAILRSQAHGGTALGSAIRSVTSAEQLRRTDRIIVITDEQSNDTVGAPPCRGYIINVASYKNGVGSGDWLRVDGFSESVLRWVSGMERPNS